MIFDGCSHWSNRRQNTFRRRRLPIPAARQRAVRYPYNRMASCCPPVIAPSLLMAMRTREAEREEQSAGEASESATEHKPPALIRKTPPTVAQNNTASRRDTVDDRWQRRHQ